MFIEVEGVDALHDRLKPAVKIVMPLETKFYGMREFAIEDPDGYVITFAERVPQPGRLCTKDTSCVRQGAVARDDRAGWNSCGANADR